MKVLRMAVIGLGRLGYVHAYNIKYSIKANLIAVCDMDEKVAVRTSEELECAAYTDIHQLLKGKILAQFVLLHPLHVILSRLPLWLKQNYLCFVRSLLRIILLIIKISKNNKRIRY